MNLIFTRFSVLTPHGFQNRSPRETSIRSKTYLPRWLKTRLIGRPAKKSLDEVAVQLFAPERMEERFFYFEHVCLASLANQTSQAFRHIVMVSPEMPADQRKRLEGLQSRFGFVIVEVARDASITKVAQAVTKTHSADAEVIITSRLDDDDALCKDFLQRTDDIVQRSRPGTVISFPNGIEMKFDGKGASVRPRFFPFFALGMAYVEANNGRPKTIFGCGQHRFVAEKHACHCDPMADAYVVSAHAGNDSNRFVDNRAIGDAGDHTDISQVDAAYYADRFGLDLKRLGAPR
ncbi:MAG: glycosyltransferase [Pseudomonadota bacterium]